MLVRVLCATAVLAISACGSYDAPRYQPQPYKYWAKEGVSSQAAKDQLGYCRHDVGANHLEKAQADKLVSYCMRSKGYTLMTGYR